MSEKEREEFTYKKAGVDIYKEEEVISALVSGLSYKRKGIGSPHSLKGHYAGLVDFGEYALVLCTDGVGTKLLVAKAMNKWDTIGIDCIAMNVNDIICLGATPLAFVDYIAVEKPEPEIFAEIGKGLNKGAEMANISVVGGETATLPEMVKGLDLAGTCLGYVKKEEIVKGEKIRKGDVVIGLKSSGIHSNGFSLARKIFEKNGYSYTEGYGEIESIGLELLKPTKIYVKEILSLLEKRFEIKGLAHITGGGLRNIVRLNRNVKFKIEEMFEPQPIFKALQELGNVNEKEMYTTFNMGLGFVVVVAAEESEEVLHHLETLGSVEAKIVGRVVEETRGGGGEVVFKGMRFA
ncbi:MAG TPA: phosphoribosylformylglycinamidine cyclo-ligase [Thermoplasmata archaeon]|nr:phosphoribosylformylglycinamidine cyclo-ligase [Thermoplasmata archaeon]